MNERIEELAREAGHVYVGGHPVPYYQFSNNQLEKFAQLIVQECLEICKKREQANLYGVREVENTIKEHFGIE